MHTQIDRRLAWTLPLLLASATLLGCSHKSSETSAESTAPAPRASHTAHAAAPATQDPAATPPPAAPTAAVPVQQFAGEYHTNWGSCTLTQEGEVVTGTCARAYTLSCRAQESTLHCDWTSPAKGTHGKNRLTAEPGGRLVGPWGKDTNESGGGIWIFTRA
jgi:hypothetical protein